MSKKHKYFIFIVIALFLLKGQLAFALEVNYPCIPGAPVISPCTPGSPIPSPSLSQYIQYFFILIILSAAGIGVISIAISGFQILFSFGNPASRGVAVERIRNAIIGIILLMSSYIILVTINTEFINPKTTFAGLTPGVYLRNFVGIDDNHPDGYEYHNAPPRLEDTGSEPDNTELWYYCTNPDKDLLVWEYDEPGFVQDGNETTVSLKCNDPGLPITGSLKSFETSKEDFGVYFYSREDCTGFSSEAQKSSGIIKYYDKVKSVRIVSGLSKDERYGVVLDKRGGGLIAGECSQPIIQFDPSNTDCTKIPPDLDGNDFNPFYAYIIKYNPDYADYGSVSSNVKLYSKNLFAKLDQGNSILVGPPNTDYNIGKEFLYKPGIVDGNPDDLIREQYVCDNMVYTSGPDQNECCTGEESSTPCGQDDSLRCKDQDPRTKPDEAGTIKSCLNGLEVNGSYYVFLYSRNDKSGQRMCEDFFHDENDIQSSDLLSDNKVIYKLVIIPRR